MTDIFVVGDRPASVASAVVVAPQHTFRKEAGTPGESHISHLNIKKDCQKRGDLLGDPDIVHGEWRKSMTGGRVHDEFLDTGLTTTCVVEHEDAALGAGGARIIEVVSNLSDKLFVTRWTSSSEEIGLPSSLIFWLTGRAKAAHGRIADSNGVGHVGSKAAYCRDSGRQVDNAQQCESQNAESEDKDIDGGSHDVRHYG